MPLINQLLNRMNITEATLRNWMIQKIAEEAGIKEEEINADAPFESFSLDSLSLVSISYDLENFSGKTVDPTVFGEYQTINKLVSWLDKQQN